MSSLDNNQWRKWTVKAFMLISVGGFALATAGSATAWPTPADPTNEPFHERFWSSATPAPVNAEPIAITTEVRRPLIYFRQIANRRWKAGVLFAFLFLISAGLKLFLPRLTEAAACRCQTNFFASLSAAFIFSTMAITIIRFSFLNDALSAMGLFTFGFLQLSFALGGCLGVNVLAQNLYAVTSNKVSKNPTELKPAARTGLYTLCLITVVTILCLVSMIPGLGPLPRVGNRMVMLIAALGLGGLVNLLVVSSKKVEP
ncbi:MAG: hypothetical protein KGS72_00805 [Cyanobacteria bacterium REEB67]|nr:hypothetical protein [Cyanobacteria bacterium REEB67]